MKIMKLSFRRFWAALLVFMLSGNMVGALEPVVFATDWKAQAEQGGFYQAKALGLYEKAGLDVVIRSGGPGVNIPQLLGAGAIDFGMGSNSFIPLNMVRRCAGQGGDGGVPKRPASADYP